MEPDELSQRPYDQYGRPIEPSFGQKLKKLLAPIGGLFVVLFKYLKFVLPVLKTGGTMIVAVGFYALLWPWRFAVGFVLLIFIHECGHLLAAKRIGLKVGAPVFIPFMGAIIALKDAPRNAWIEAQVGIAGPIFGAIGATICLFIYMATGERLYCALAYSGFFLNLFNLAPIGFLDGGRVVSALSPWLWVIGYVIMIGMIFVSFNFVVLLILVLSLPRLFSLFRPRSDDERRYFEVTPAQRWFMAALYFGLIIYLALAMEFTYIPPHALR